MQCRIWIQLISQHQTVIRDFNSWNRDAAWVPKQGKYWNDGFYLMHFGFALELSNVDLLNIDLLDTHLDLLITDIPSKYFACLHNFFKKSSGHIFKTSSRRLQDVFKNNICLLSTELNLIKYLSKKAIFSKSVHFFSNRCFQFSPLFGWDWPYGCHKLRAE